MIGDAPRGGVVQVDHQAEIIANGVIVAFDSDLRVGAPIELPCGQIGLHIVFDTVQCQPASDRDMIIDAISNGGVQAFNLNLAIGAMVASLERTFVIVHKAIESVYAQAESEAFVNRYG